MSHFERKEEGCWQTTWWKFSIRTFSITHLFTLVKKRGGHSKNRSGKTLRTFYYFLSCSVTSQQYKPQLFNQYMCTWIINIYSKINRLKWFSMQITGQILLAKMKHYIMWLIFSYDSDEATVKCWGSAIFHCLPTGSI